MNLYEFSRLIYRNFLLLVLVPILISATIFLVSKKETRFYQSSTLIYTGMGSGYNIESGSGDKMDYREVNTGYDNLMAVMKSRLTLEEAGLRLLARCLIQEAPGPVIGKQAFEDLKEIFPVELRKDIVVPSDEEQTFQNLQKGHQDGNPTISQFIHNTGAFSISTLQKAEVKRIKSSDMVELIFVSYDPGLSKSTLDVLLSVFISRYRQMKKSETGDVVAYFESELKKAKENLNIAEDELTTFRVKSRVINYGEETKALAIKKQNALEEFAAKKMNLKATEAALNQLEEKLEIRREFLTHSSQLLEKKRELAKITSEISILIASQGESALIARQQAEEDRIKTDIEQMMYNLVGQQSTKEGLTGKQLVTDWLNNLILYNREKVNVELYKQRLNEIDFQYDNFTPMGSNIDRLERQISVFEREYLEVLHGLNQAKLRQQNIELTTNLEIVDPPIFPEEPLPSKRKMMIMVGFAVGFIGVITFLIAGEFLDQSLRTPEKAHEITGLKVIAGFPVVNSRFMKDHPEALDQLTSILTSKVTIELPHSPKKPKTILLGSTTQYEGRSTIGQYLTEGLQKMGYRAALSSPEFLHTEKRIDLDFLIIKIPAMVTGKFPIQIIEEADLTLLVGRADRVWSKAHKNAVEDLTRISNGKKPMLILNALKTHHLDQLLGENPTKHSKFINWIRKMVRFEFSESLKTERP